MHFENFLLFSHFSGVSENLSLSFNFTLFLYDFSPDLFNFPLILPAYSSCLFSTLILHLLKLPNFLL